MRTIVHPRIFLSYAREDYELALVLCKGLIKEGFSVFLDTEQILAGEDFVRRINGELRRAQAVVALLTAHSVESSWCQAELYQAHAMGISIIPVQVASEALGLVLPLASILQRIHRIEVRNVGELGVISIQLAVQLQAVRSQARRRTLGRLLGIVGLLALLWSGVFFTIRGVNSWNEVGVRRAIVDRLQGGKRTLSSSEIAGIAQRFQGDRELLGKVLLLARDDTAEDTARLNGIMLGAALDPGGPVRWQVSGIDWSRGEVRGAKLVDITFASRRIDHVGFHDTTFGGVVWGEPPSFEMSNIQFVHCRFDFTWFARTKAVALEFVNSSFRGSEIDVTNFSLVKFFSRSTVPPDSNLVTDEVLVVENSVILNREQQPEPGVMDLSHPQDQVSFHGVVFEGVHFRGWIRPEWFVACSFRNCTFPTNLSRSNLAAKNNSTENCVWRNEDLR